MTHLRTFEKDALFYALVVLSCMVLRFNVFACDFENAINLGRRMKMINVCFLRAENWDPLNISSLWYKLMGLRVIL